MNEGLCSYDLELGKAAKKIIVEKAKTVMIQLPDGLKPKAKHVRQELLGFLKKSGFNDVKILFWAGSCFGACDVPVSADKLGVDLLIQFGHSEWE